MDQIMHPHRLYHLLSSSSLHLVIFLLIFVNISLAQDNENYRSCGSLFQCGNVTASFPFWGQGRPSYCGHPGFELDCEDGTIPTIKDTKSQKYRILEIKTQSRILNIVSMGILDGTCPPQFPSMDNTLFPITSSANRNVSLFDCPTVPPGTVTQGLKFTCSSSGVSGDFYYFGADEIPNCNNSFVVPVLQTSFDRFISNPSNQNQNQGLIGLLKDGFQVEWIRDTEQCSRCIQSRGRCGYNQQNPICFCSDGPHETTCTSPPATSPASPISKKSSKALSVGLGVGISAAFGVIFLLCFFLIYRRRRRNKLQQLPSSSSPILLSNKSISSKTTSKINMDYEEGSNNFTGVQIFTYTELDEATDHFDASKELGDGGFGTVYYGVLKDGRQVAVKRLFENNYKRVEQFMNEVEILTRMRHQNLVTLYGSTSHNSRELLLVYEFVANGTVADHLHGGRSKPGQLKWASRMDIAMESASALTYLHASDIIHRDVKTTNILLDKNFGVKVADFGLSRLFPTNVTHVSTAPQGTPGYVDPEYYQCYQITDKSDVYSFGVVLIELISSKPAVDTNRHRYEINLASMAINKIRNGELHEMVDPYLGFESDQIVRTMIISVAELAFRCLQQQREMRPSMAEVWEVLKGIKSEVYKMENADVVDIPADDIGLLDDIRTISPESTTTTSKSTTPYTSSSSA